MYQVQIGQADYLSISDKQRHLCMFDSIEGRISHARARTSCFLIARYAAINPSQKQAQGISLTAAQCTSSALIPARRYDLPWLEIFAFTASSQGANFSVRYQVEAVSCVIVVENLKRRVHGRCTHAQQAKAQRDMEDMAPRSYTSVFVCLDTQIRALGC